MQVITIERRGGIDWGRRGGCMGVIWCSQHNTTGEGGDLGGEGGGCPLSSWSNNFSKCNIISLVNT